MSTHKNPLALIWLLLTSVVFFVFFVYVLARLQPQIGKEHYEVGQCELNIWTLVDRLEGNMPELAGGPPAACATCEGCNNPRAKYIVKEARFTDHDETDLKICVYHEGGALHRTKHKGTLAAIFGWASLSENGSVSYHSFTFEVSGKEQEAFYWSWWDEFQSGSADLKELQEGLAKLESIVD